MSPRELHVFRFWQILLAHFALKRAYSYAGHEWEQGVVEQTVVYSPSNDQRLIFAPILLICIE